MVRAMSHAGQVPPPSIATRSQEALSVFAVIFFGLLVIPTTPCCVPHVALPFLLSQAHSVTQT